MGPTDKNIERLVKKLNYETSDQTRERIYNNVQAGLHKKSTKADLNVWSIIMKNKITKLAVAAVMIIGVLIGINSFLGTGTSIVFADVIQPILDARTVIMDILIGPEGRQVVIHDKVMGSRIHRTVSNVQGTDIIIDLEKMKVLVITHAEKTAIYVELEGLGNMQNYLELLQDVVVRMQDKDEFQIEDQGLQEIDGYDYIVFVAESDKDTITIWVDPKTALIKQHFFCKFFFCLN